MKYMGRIALIFCTLLVGIISAKQDWWEHANFYQVYPRSFKDSNGDGIGDLNGIRENLVYLKAIGMKGVWLSPIFKSPMVDFGYDISDYYEIQPEYGTVDDLEKLIEYAHKLGLKLILDFVPNHTSDQHEWFQKSINSDPAYKDFYVWHDGVLNATTGKHDPPSNWISNFRYSAWEWNDKRQQYYLHQFSVKQPDLNFRNPAVHAALKEVMIFWLKKGIDGFRIDAVPFFYEADIDPKTGTYPDEPVIDDVASCPDPNAYCHLKHIYTLDNPLDIDVIYDWRKIMDDWKREHGGETKVLLTEAYTSFKNLMLMYGNGLRNGSNVPFNFEMFDGLTIKSNASDYKYYVDHWLNNMPKGVSANWVLGNHDNPRLATRLGPKRIDLLNIFLQTLPGIAVTYYGEEYGQEDVDISWKDTVDPRGCNTSPETYRSLSRDPVRTPFRWNGSRNAGFSTANHTWLPVGNGYKKNNVAVQFTAVNSHLKIFIKLTELRKTELAFAVGNYESKVVKDVLIYKRVADAGCGFLVILNIGSTDVTLDLRKVFKGVRDKVQVVVSSLNSGIRNDKIVASRRFVAKKDLGYVVRIL